MMNNAEARFHTEYGRHSLIPLCCIRFFVEEWSPHYTTRWKGTAYWQAVNDSSFDYVPCPECFYNKRQVQIRHCAVECGRECVEEFRQAIYRGVQNDNRQVNLAGHFDGNQLSRRARTDKADMHRSSPL